MQKEIEQQIKDFKLNNVEFISKALSFEELTQLMNGCHISLGQFEHNDRLKRTIPHKAFESLAMRIPYITGRAEGVQEILKDGENCLMVNLANPEDLVEKLSYSRIITYLERNLRKTVISHTNIDSPRKFLAISCVRCANLFTKIASCSFNNIF